VLHRNYRKEPWGTHATPMAGRSTSALPEWCVFATWTSPELVILKFAASELSALLAILVNSCQEFLGSE
jgi:hypothetical protein